MYEEKRFVRKRINWVSVFLKLLLLLLIVFLIWFLIYKHKSSNNNVKGNTMTDNLSYFKKQSIKYFDEKNLPKYVNGQTKVTLDEMIKSGASKNIIDKDGNKCSALSSYASVTKMDNKNYNLKVYLKCRNEADSILTSITKEEFIKNKLTVKKSTKQTNNNDKKNTKKTTNTKNDTILINDTTTTKNDNKKTTSSKSTNTKSSSSKSTSKTSTSKTSTSTSSSSKTTVGQSTSTKTSSSTSSSSTSTSSSSSSSSSSTSSSNSSSTSSSSSSSSTSSTTNTKELLYTEYLLVKYGDWTITKPTSGKYVTRTVNVIFNRYCYGKDYQNCHVIAKLDKYKKDIDYLLSQGYEELHDHTESRKVYLPYETIWSKSKNVAGYEYTGDHREIYKQK